MKGATKHVLILLAVGALILFTNLGVPRLWDRDEPRNAGCAAEMIARGDWVVPWFNDELRTHKPVLLYWLIMAAYSLFGVNEFSARLGSALLGLGTIVWTYVIGSRLFHARIGLLAGIVLASTLMFDVASRAATPDSSLIFFVTASVGAFVLGVFPNREATGAMLPVTVDAKSQNASRGIITLDREDWRLSLPAAFGVYGMMALAVLAKGPVGLVLPVAIIGLFVAIARSQVLRGSEPAAPWFANVARVLSPLHLLGCASRLRPVVALLVVLIIAAPWYIAVGVRTDGEFLRGFLWEHNFSRAMESREGHGGGLWFYPLAILAGFFPWSVFALPTVIGVVRSWRRSDDNATRASLILLLGWCAIWVGAFSLAKTKLPSYVTPCYPAIAVLVAFTLVGWMERWQERASSISTAWVVPAFAVLSVIGMALVLGLPRVASRYLPDEGWLGYFGFIPGVAGLIACLFVRSGAREWAVRTCTVAAIMFATCFFGVGTVVVDRHQENHRLLAALPAVDREADVFSLGTLEPSWVFYSKRPIRELVAQRNEPANQRAISGGYAKSPTTFAEFLEKKHDGYVITTRRQFNALPDAFREEMQCMIEVPLFLKSEDLVLLRRRPTEPVSVARPLARPIDGPTSPNAKR